MAKEPSATAPAPPDDENEPLGPLIATAPAGVEIDVRIDGPLSYGLNPLSITTELVFRRRGDVAHEASLRYLHRALLEDLAVRVDGRSYFVVGWRNEASGDEACVVVTLRPA